MKKKLLAILLALLFTVCFVFSVGADFGDYGGDSDYGGGYDSYDSYDSYDYDDYDYDDDDDYYSSGSYSGSTSGGSGDSRSALGGAVVFAVIVIVVVLLAKKKKGKGGTKGGAPIMPGATPTNAASLRNINEYLTVDPQFSEAAFKEKLANMYVRFQHSWTAKNMDDLRPYLSDALFAQCDSGLDHYRITFTTNVVEKIAVLDTAIVGWTQQGGNDTIVARLRTRIIDYTVNDDTGEVIKGSKTAEKFMEYEWTLSRTSGQVTQNGVDGTKAQNCPNCGAPININSTAKCEYCGSILTTDTFDWVVTNIKGISQRTVG